MGTATPTAVLPMLHSGDHLTFDEFVERAARSPYKHAELIQGIVFVAPAQRYRFHGEPLSFVLTLLTLYMVETPGVQVLNQLTVKLDQKNGPEPDIYLRLPESHGGQCRVNDEGYLEGAPELVIEVAASSVSYDLFEKKAMYEAAGVKEYLVWRAEEEEIDCFELVDGSFRPHFPEDGIWESRTFQGLRLDLNAFLKYDLKRARSLLEEGLRSDAHRLFCASLEKASS